MSSRKAKQISRQEMTGVERLGLRVSAMINSPISQLARRVTIHRLDTDSDEAWSAVMGELAETDGLEMVVNDDDGTVTLQWDRPTDDDHVLERGEVEPVEEAAPF